MIIKNFSTEHGIVISNTEVSRLDNGQVLLHIVSRLGEAVHEHRVTVGAEDGKDRLSSLSEEELQDILQNHLNEKRNEAAQILAGRARVAKVSADLQ